MKKGPPPDPAGETEACPVPRRAAAGPGGLVQMQPRAQDLLGWRSRFGQDGLGGGDIRNRWTGPMPESRSGTGISYWAQ